MSGSSSNRKESERTKLIQEKCQSLLNQMLRDEDNKYCVDCDAKGPRWASWNLGVFLCIRCAGIHRNLGVHISRVKSVNLDTWTPEQVISLQQMGNSRARAVYEAQLPDGFRRPQTDTALESFIRAKYEHKKYLAREWVQPSPPKVDWAKEIDEELERQKRKKKAAQANTSLGIGVLSTEKKLNANTTATTKTTPLPAPLPKPKAHGSENSPKTQRSIPAAAAAAVNSNVTNDLLGLSSPTKPTKNLANSINAASAANEAHNDSFSNFLSATPTSENKNELAYSGNGGGGGAQNSLAQDEEDFFNQGTLNMNEKDKTGKLTKDSILALYGQSATNTPQMLAYAQPTTTNVLFGGVGGGAAGYPTAGAGGYASMMQPLPQQQQQQQQQQQPHAQFMTPPNSASMYNAPVMTAPTAFTSAVAGGMPFASQYAPGAGMPGMQNLFAQQQMLLTNSANYNNMQQTNQHNLMNATAGSLQQQPLQLQQQSTGFGMLGSVAGQLNPPQLATNPTTNNLNQQFGNLNIGNVWQ